MQPPYNTYYPPQPHPQYPIRSTPIFPNLSSNTYQSFPPDQIIYNSDELVDRRTYYPPRFQGAAPPTIPKQRVLAPFHHFRHLRSEHSIESHHNQPQISQSRSRSRSRRNTITQPIPLQGSPPLLPQALVNAPSSASSNLSDTASDIMRRQNAPRNTSHQPLPPITPPMPPTPVPAHLPTPERHHTGLHFMETERRRASIPGYYAENTRVDSREHVSSAYNDTFEAVPHPEIHHQQVLMSNNITPRYSNPTTASNGNFDPILSVRQPTTHPPSGRRESRIRLQSDRTIRVKAARPETIDSPIDIDQPRPEARTPNDIPRRAERPTHSTAVDQTARTVPARVRIPTEAQPINGQRPATTAPTQPIVSQTRQNPSAGRSGYTHTPSTLPATQTPTQSRRISSDAPKTDHTRSTGNPSRLISADDTRVRSTYDSVGAIIQARPVNPLSTSISRNTQFEDDLEEEMTCPICRSVMVAPHQFSPCGHALCGGCGVQWIMTRAGAGEQVNCPVCRNPADPLNPLIPARNLENLIKRWIDNKVAVEGEWDGLQDFKEREECWNIHKAHSPDGIIPRSLPTTSVPMIRENIVNRLTPALITPRGGRYVTQADGMFTALSWAMDASDNPPSTRPDSSAGSIRSMLTSLENFSSSDNL
ncbi:uncharacterized protein L201_002002 [Kwoniella dendrophila CBS 6074]|uniref:RING-type domain-containing protein n=1 Tax=Kwoniella dendrophila CBS 6074 TaxID=1295534 RepID=A0AAX4JP14_9TREE